MCECAYVWELCMYEYVHAYVCVHCDYACVSECECAYE